MERRRFLGKAALGAAAVGTLAGCNTQQGEADTAGAPAATGRRVRWRLASSFPRSAAIIYHGAVQLAERVQALTEGRFEIIPYPAGEIVPPFQVLDAVQNRTVHMGHTAGYYYIGKNPALAFETGVPFGLLTRSHNAWMYHGGGLDLIRQQLADFRILSFPGGNTGCQMGGWFRREVHSLADLNGLKMRIPGIGAQVMDRLGVSAQTLPGGEIYQALERGAIDATEWIGPYDDEQLGFHKVARFYYYPGWWEPSAMLSFYVNRDEYERLPAAYQQALDVATREVNQSMLAEYDAKNPEALQRLLDQGVQLRPFPEDILRAAQQQAQALYRETAAQHPGYATVLGSYEAYRTAQNRWFNVAEQRMAVFTLQT